MRHTSTAMPAPEMMYYNCPSLLGYQAIYYVQGAVRNRVQQLMPILYLRYGADL
jgi:hypothetical protein